MASNNQSERTSPGDWRIPVVVAAVAWFASAIAVIGYTYIAFKETVSGEGDSLNSNPPGEGTTITTSGANIPGVKGKVPLANLPPLPNESPKKAIPIPQWELKRFGSKLNKPSPAAPQPKQGRGKLR